MFRDEDLSWFLPKSLTFIKVTELDLKRIKQYLLKSDLRLRNFSLIIKNFHSKKAKRKATAASRSNKNPHAPCSTGKAIGFAEILLLRV